MDFSELVAEVIIITGRPDRVSETEQAVRAATLKVHQLEFWSKDLAELEVDLGSEDYKHNFDYETDLTDFRQFKSFEKLENTGDDEGTPLEIVTADELFDSYHRRRTNICYVAGTNLKVISDTEFQYALVSYYKNPVVTDVGFTSWIARLVPYAIVHEAARTACKAIAKDEEATTQRELFGEQLKVLRTVGITDVGY